MAKWTNESVAEELRRITGALGSFPTSSELRSMGRNDLCCAATKSGGLIEWANRLGLARKDSDSDFGWRGEDAAVNLFASHGFIAVRQRAVKAPFDILVNDVFRVDVKTANRMTYWHSTGWFYRLGKIPQADFIFLYQADTGAFYGLPWYVCPRTNITISTNGGRYAPYLNNWSLVRQMIGVRMAERANLIGGIPEVA